MNKTYRSVWSETDQTWVAAPETASARVKTAARRSAVAITGALGVAAGLAPAPAFAAAGTVGLGGLELCTGAKGYAYGSAGGGESLDCSAESAGAYNGVAFALNNAADTKGGYGFSAATAQVAGYNDGTLTLTGTRVFVHGPTTFDSVVTMSNQKIVQLAPGLVSPSSMDAINGSQLYAAVADAVQYDTSAHGSVTLGGTSASKPVFLHNVANGALSASSLDAVNGSQLYDAMNSATTHYVGINSAAGAGNYAGEGAIGSDAIAIGANTTAAGDQSVAVGSTAQARGSQSTAMGQAAYATAYDATALGAASVADESGTAIGANAYAAGNALAAGAGAQSFGNAVALGANANAQQAGAIAIGTNSSVGGQNAVAIGMGAVSSNAGDVALGAASTTDTATGTSSTTIRGTSYDFAGTNPASTVSVGSVGNERTMTNVAAGRLSATSTDAINGSQLYVTNQAIENFKLPYIDGTGQGASAQAKGLNSVALGYGSVADEALTVSVGRPDQTRRITNVAEAQTDTDAVNLGQVKDLLGLDASNPVSQVALNASDSASPDTASANSRRALAAAAPGSATGASATDATTDATALHYDSSSHASVTLSSTSGGNVQLSGLQNASLADGSTDAVTGQQLFATNQQLDNLSQSVQNISTTGSIAVAANTTSGAAAASGAQSLAVGGGAVATGNSATAIGDKASASADNSVAIGANSIANRANAVSVGSEGAERQIVNVAAGTSGTDAVNLNQLNNAITQQSNAFNQQITGLQNSINTVSKNAYAGVAAAMAMPNLTPSGPGRTVVAAGGGYYMGGSAAAVGVTYRSVNMHWLVNGGVSVTSTGNTAARAQVGYEF